MKTIKHLFWALKYWYYMNKNIRGIRYSFDCARTAYYEYADWQEDDAEDAVIEELSYWGD